MGVYQKDIAQIIRVTTDTIALWEKGRTKPCKKNISKIERFLKTDDEECTNCQIKEQ